MPNQCQISMIWLTMFSRRSFKTMYWIGLCRGLGLWRTFCDFGGSMSSYITPDRSPAPYIEPTPEATQPHVPEVGATSAPLKSAAFFIGAHCQDYNGASIAYHHNQSKYSPTSTGRYSIIIDDFMLCKGENRDAAHCLKEGRRVTRCAIDLWVILWHDWWALQSKPRPTDSRSYGKIAQASSKRTGNVWIIATMFVSYAISLLFVAWSLAIAYVGVLSVSEARTCTKQLCVWETSWVFDWYNY